MVTFPQSFQWLLECALFLLMVLTDPKCYMFKLLVLIKRNSGKIHLLLFSVSHWVLKI